MPLGSRGARRRGHYVEAHVAPIWLGGFTKALWMDAFHSSTIPHLLGLKLATVVVVEPIKQLIQLVVRRLEPDLAANVVPELHHEIERGITSALQSVGFGGPWRKTKLIAGVACRVEV